MVKPGRNALEFGRSKRTNPWRRSRLHFFQPGAVLQICSGAFPTVRIFARDRAGLEKMLAAEHFEQVRDFVLDVFRAYHQLFDLFAE